MKKVYKIYLLPVIIALNLLVSTSIYAMEEGVATIAELKKQYAAFKEVYTGKNKIIKFVNNELKNNIDEIVEDAKKSDSEVKEADSKEKCTF